MRHLALIEFTLQSFDEAEVHKLEALTEKGLTTKINKFCKRTKDNMKHARCPYSITVYRTTVASVESKTYFPAEDKDNAPV